jgi:hypothetical protein
MFSNAPILYHSFNQLHKYFTWPGFSNIYSDLHIKNPFNSFALSDEVINVALIKLLYFVTSNHRKLVSLISPFPNEQSLTSTLTRKIQESADKYINSKLKLEKGKNSLCPFTISYLKRNCLVYAFFRSHSNAVINQLGSLVSIIGKIMYFIFTPPKNYQPNLFDSMLRFYRFSIL